jgi:hypothetical protein
MFSSRFQATVRPGAAAVQPTCRNSCGVLGTTARPSVRPSPSPPPSLSIRRQLLHRRAEPQALEITSSSARSSLARCRSAASPQQFSVGVPRCNGAAFRVAVPVSLPRESFNSKAARERGTAMSTGATRAPLARHSRASRAEPFSIRRYARATKGVPAGAGVSTRRCATLPKTAIRRAPPHRSRAARVTRR